MAAPSPFPLKIRQQAELVHGVHTEVLLAEFRDRLLVLVTQLGKIGNLLQCTLSECAKVPNFMDELLGNADTEACSRLVPLPVFTVSTDQQELQQLFATQLAEKVAAQRPQEQRPLLVSITLRTATVPSRDLLQRVEAMLVACL
ncbi:hypothetical protein THASP1DRAFT_29581 [Thamnocephalis sphaerospora]|uniref:Uncharacterized protein n=1 Tax=Thamnocephalis sphaerospora TaxID=78915 RepID=A0A4P9XRA7_9FUNG|nr:hypothetical protein THASP1DRAFT_29581 [Thamnocephalis sphaerospora]|eukprot:RKP08614.1 hypothetical protein THASP1DRAFT_29581 [Thamnocephalis sphaerospora]